MKGDGRSVGPSPVVPNDGGPSAVASPADGDGTNGSNGVDQAVISSDCGEADPKRQRANGKQPPSAVIASSSSLPVALEAPKRKLKKKKKNNGH